MTVLMSIALTICIWLIWYGIKCINDEPDELDTVKAFIKTLIVLLLFREITLLL